MLARGGIDATGGVRKAADRLSIGRRVVPFAREATGKPPCQYHPVPGAQARRDLLSETRLSEKDPGEGAAAGTGAGIAPATTGGNGTVVSTTLLIVLAPDPLIA